MVPFALEAGTVTGFESTMSGMQFVILSRAFNPKFTSSYLQKLNGKVVLL